LLPNDGLPTATAKRSNDRVLKACHPVFIKLHEIGYLGFIRLEIQGGPEDKSRILDKIEKRLTKMS
jgi:hypothetical protein